MNKTKVWLITVILISTVCAANTEKKNLGVTFDLTYMSKYMTKGSEGYGQQGGLFETIDIDLWGTGFGVSVGHQGATSNGYVDKQRFNYRVYYGGSLFEGEAYKTKYKFSWTYEGYYGRARNIKNSQEWAFKFSWPEILPIENLAPYYTLYYEYPAGSNYNNRNISGFLHCFGLNYKLNTPELPNPLGLSAELSYRDGLGGPSKDHDWSHATFGISTKFEISKNILFVPGLYHQISMDDTVCKRDVTYCKLSIKYTF